MTNWEWIKSLDKKQMALVLAYFADHENHCALGNYECDGCPIQKDKMCGYPDISCDVSAFRWLNAEHNPNTIPLEYGDYLRMVETGQEVGGI